MATVSVQEQQIASSPQPAEAPVTVQENFIFRSKFTDIEIHNSQPLHSYCFEKIDEYKDRPCLIDGSTDRIYTFAETHLLCRKSAAGLSALGIKQGDVIMLLLQNCPEFAFVFMASSMVGSAVTTANPFCTSHEIYKQFKASGAKIVVTQSSYIDKLRSEEFPTIGEELTVVTIDGAPEGCLGFSSLTDVDHDQIPDVVDFDPNDAVALPFSSGTTGLPKGVVLTHKSIITSIAQQVDGENPNLYIKPDDVVLCVLPLFHIFSLNSVLLCSLRAGAGVLLMKKFEINRLLELIPKHRVSIAAVVPPLVLALAKDPKVENYDLSSIRIVLSGAAPLGKDLQDALKRRVPQAIFGQVRI